MISTSRIFVEPIAYRDPVAAFAPLANTAFAVLLSGGGQSAQSQFAYIAADPFRTLTQSSTVSSPFAELRAALETYRMTSPASSQGGAALPAPFIGGAVGFVGYEVGSALEALPPRKAAWFPLDVAFGLYDVVVAFDLAAQKAWVMSSGLPETEPAAQEARARARAREMIAKLGDAAPDIPRACDAIWTADFSPQTYEAKVANIIERIRAGEIYQANMTQRWTAPWPQNLTPFGLYQRLRSQSAAPFSAYLNLGAKQQIISASPERFLYVDACGRVETRPIKGTRPRGKTAAEDKDLAAELRASTKDRSENLMIVDLLRNDISRACVPGSVDVPSLCALETFPTVHHLVSVVTGQLRPECTAVDLLAACFPGGSITGAPKIRAMRVIHELEPVARGPYCGTVAWFGFDGAMDSSIIIRTLVRSGDTLAAQAGGGIVADSVPAQEYAESVLKATPLLAALNGDGSFTCGSA